MPKKRNKKVVWTVIIAVIMVSSAFGVIFGSFAGQSSRFRYNGFSFSITDKGYRAKLDGRDIYFSYSPYDVAAIPVDSGVGDRIRSARMLYISYNASSSQKEPMAQAQFLLSRSLEDSFSIYSAPAMLDANQYNIPVINCANATAFVPVIAMVESNETRIKSEKDCILFESSGSDFALLVDRLLYSLFGIIN